MDAVLRVSGAISCQMETSSTPAMPTMSAGVSKSVHSTLGFANDAFLADCSQTFAGCNTDFLNNMITICNTINPPGIQRNMCLRRARFYHSAVSGSMGAGVFTDTIEQYCDCVCDDPDLTACQDKCVDTKTDPENCGSCNFNVSLLYFPLYISCSHTLYLQPSEALGSYQVLLYHQLPKPQLRFPTLQTQPISFVKSKSLTQTHSVRPNHAPTAPAPSTPAPARHAAPLAGAAAPVVLAYVLPSRAVQASALMATLHAAGWRTAIPAPTARLAQCVLFKLAARAMCASQRICVAGSISPATACLRHWDRGQMIQRLRIWRMVMSNVGFTTDLKCEVSLSHCWVKMMYYSNKAEKRALKRAA